MTLRLDFVKLWSSYETLLSLPTGKKPCNGPWANQCAIRMAIVLEGSGVSFKGAAYSDPKCSHGHPRGAESLANWLWKKHGAPSVHSDPEQAKKDLARETGIIFFKNCFTRDGSTVQSGDHIDLWKKGLVQTYDDPGNLSQQVWFWSVG
jgi:hypothetical protein